MKKLVIIILVAFTAFGWFISTSAAPAPTLFVYNDAKKECGTFRDGDEYVSYTLPQGWQTYNYEKSMAKSTQEYCNDLGYKNIGSIVSYLKLEPKTLRTQEPNYPYNNKQSNYTLLIILVTIFVLSTFSILFILHKKQKNTQDNH